MSVNPQRKSLKSRFLAKINRDSSGCWLWTACIDPYGYGSLHGERLGGSRNSTSLRAHRVSYELFVGPIPDGLLVLHKCDVRSCVNPKHLFLGTHKDNSDDKISKGRQRWLVGEKSHQTRLSAEQVIEIRSSKEDSKVVAKRFGISRYYVYDIRKMRAWKHLGVQPDGS